MSYKTPLYKHDCPACTFLGVYRAQDRRRYDLYHCHDHGDHVVIARWSNRGQDYYCAYARSMPTTRDMLTEALRRARERNLVPADAGVRCSLCGKPLLKGEPYRAEDDTWVLCQACEEEWDKEERDAANQ